MSEPATAPPFPLSGVPTAPRRPSSRASKLVLRPTAIDWILLLFGFVFLLVGVVATVSSAESVASDLSLAIEGKQATGRVVSLVEDTTRTNRSQRYPWEIHIAYEVAGRTYETESRTYNDAIVAASQVGAEVAIEYSERHPEWARVAGTTRNASGYAAVLVLLFPLIGLLFTYVTFRKFSRRRRAFTFGRAVVAEVTKFGPDHSTKVNGRPQFEMRWKYTVGGQEHEGRLQASDEGKLADFASAKAVVVLYLEDAPAVSTVWVP